MQIGTFCERSAMGSTGTETTEMSLDRYCQQFARLRRAPGRSFPATTRNRAPHKPLLLLAVMDMVGRGQITDCFISITGELTELNELFTGYWRSLMPPTHTSSIAFPFSRLHSEPFWELISISGQQMTSQAINAVETVPQLRKLALGARLDDELLLLMNQKQARTRLAETLLQSCFSDAGADALRTEIGIQQQAYQYSLELEDRIYDKVAKPKTAYSVTARNQGFRRAVVHCYDHRCALCGVRIVTPEGHTVVEAAHIQPWSQFQDDDVRNGMALCRLCHWAFDEGLMGVDDEYRVLTSPQMSTAPNAAGFLMTLSGRPIIGPKTTGLWPDRSRLSWHRKHVGAGF